MHPPHQLKPFADKVSARFKIGAEHQNELLEFLRESTEEFHPRRKIVSKVGQEVRLHAELETVAKTARKLSEVLSELSDLARDRLWHPFWEDPNRRQGTIGPAGFWGEKNLPDETAFREVLSAFEKRIETRLVELREIANIGGRPENTGLHVWTGRACDFWERTLRRKFTYQYAKGVHKGKAFEFCSFVLHVIAPEITETELATALRAAIGGLEVRSRIVLPEQPD